MGAQASHKLRELAVGLEQNREVYSCIADLNWASFVNLVNKANDIASRFLDKNGKQLYFEIVDTDELQRRGMLFKIYARVLCHKVIVQSTSDIQRKGGGCCGEDEEDATCRMWECPACTFVNPPIYLCCDGCGAEKAQDSDARIATATTTTTITASTRHSAVDDGASDAPQAMPMLIEGTREMNLRQFVRLYLQIRSYAEFPGAKEGDDPGNGKHISGEFDAGRQALGGEQMSASIFLDGLDINDEDSSEECEECVICLDKRPDVILPECMHSFCDACISKWNVQRNGCPCCRRKEAAGEEWLLADIPSHAEVAAYISRAADTVT